VAMTALIGVGAATWSMLAQRRRAARG